MLDLQKSSSSPFNSCDEKNSNNRKVVPFNQQYADCDIQAVSFKMGSYNNSFNQVEEKNGIQFLQESNLQLTNQQQSNQKKLDTQYDDTIFKTFYPTSDAIEQNITNSHQKNNQIIMDDKTSTQQNIKIQSNKLQKQNTLNTTQKELVASNLKEKENSVFQQSEYLSRFNSGSIIQAKGESKVAQSNQKSHSFGNALLLIVITLYYIGTSFTDYSVLKYSILLKSFEFFSLFKKFCNLFDHNQNGLIYTQSALIVLQIFILAHISACIFITVANASAPSITWITKLQEVTEITNLTISQIYVSALYWSIITMVTLGYGDIVPISQSEIINESQKNKNKIKNDLEMLNNLIDERGLSNELKNKVRRYFEYLYKEKMKNTEIGYEMIGTLPPNLKDEVMNDLYSKILKQHPLFSKNFSDQFIAELSLTMKELKVGPELIILKKQQIQDKLYFILNGEVNSYLQKLTNVNNIIEQLTKGAVIGLQEFITQTPIEYFYKSESVASLGYIEYSEFYETLKKHPKDYEIYYKIKDKLSVYREGSACRLFCRFCKKSVHSSDECPLITYQPNINKIVYKLKQLELIQQDRDSYKRVNKQKQNSRHIFTTINDNANKVANDLVNNLQKSQETYEQSKQEIIDSLIQNQYNNEKLENESSKENKIEEQLQSIRQRRISFQLSLARKSIEHSHIFSNNTQFFYQKENSKTQYEQEENLIAESQNKLNSIDNLPQIEKTSEQPVNQKNFNNFNQLEEIKEIIHQNSNQNEGGEGSQYFSYFDQSFAQQDKINFDEEQNQNLDKIQTFNLFQIEPSSNKSFQNNLIQQNSPIKRRSQFYDQNQFEKCYSENKSVSEELVSTKCLEKSKTFTNFLFDQDNLVRFHRKKLSNVIINPNFNIFDTPLSQKHPKRTTSNNTQLHLISLQSQQNQQQQQQQLQISPTNSQTNIQHIFEEEYQLPFILLNDFDKFQNYIYYFPHNNPSLILRNIEDQRLQRIERQRKLKQKKNQNEKSKFVSSNIPDKKN